MSKRLLSCVLLVFVATFGVVACSSDGGDDVGSESGSDDVGDESGPETLLEAGDCVDADLDNSFNGDAIVDCADPHTGEIYAIVDFQFETDDALTACGEVLVDYAGQSIEDLTAAGFESRRAPDPDDESRTLCILKQEDGSQTEGPLAA